MRYIDEKFKEKTPEETVEYIQGILDRLGIRVKEHHNDSGIENCCSMHVCYEAGYPGTNGKGVTKAFARASGYAEFLERLQCGMNFFRYQSLEQNPSRFLADYAPDKRYMTKQELIENGEWMDPIIATYGHQLTREALAEQCVMYSGKEPVLTIPFYSLFENKHVYLPAYFVDKMYSANGCCAGNTRDEAWVHAFSEIMERHNCLEVLTSGKAAPVIPDSVLERFPTVMKILKKIRASGNYDIQILDYSCGYGFPVIATRIINKDTHDYLVNVGGDPILEIAIERTLTEVFQGRNLQSFATEHASHFLNRHHPVTESHNMLNQLITSDGVYTFDFFADAAPIDEKGILSYSDNSTKTNAELLKQILQMFRKIGKPVYIRNQSFLGFPCYKMVVPGFSESRSYQLTETVPEYYLTNRVAKLLHHITAASDEDLKELLLYYRMRSGLLERLNEYSTMADVPMNDDVSPDLMLYLAYAAHRLHRDGELQKFLRAATIHARNDKETYHYLRCIGQYFELLYEDISSDCILVVLRKFYNDNIIARLEENLKKPDGAFSDLLLHCEPDQCETCRYHNNGCCVMSAQELLQKVGAVYKTFTDGQNPREFQIEL